MSARRRRGALAAASLGAVGALLLVAEGIARALVAEPPRQREEVEFIERSLGYLQPCFRHDGDSLVETNAGLPGTLRHRAIRRARTPGVARIAVVGESSADLLAQSLDASLARSSCGGRVEVLNCAVPGSGLEHLQRRFDEVMQESPDAVIVTFGHNLRFVLPTSRAQLWARRLRYRSRLLTRLGALLEPAPRSSNAPLAARLPLFEDFLHRAGRETRARHVGLVVTTMAANLWMPPSSRPEDHLSPAFLDARYTEATAGPLAAAQGLAPATDPHAPLWLDFERGVLLARAGDAAAARTNLQRALERDSFATRASADVSGLIRRVAAQERFALRDTARAMEDAAPQGLPGWESFQDNCHLLPATIDQEAVAIFALARPALTVPPACAPAPGAGPADNRDIGSFFRQLRGFPPDQAALWYAAVALRVERRLLVDPAGAAQEIERYVQETRPPPPEALLALAEGSWRAGRVAAALAFNARARAATSAAAWVQLGVFQLRQHAPAEARAALRQALTIDPQRPDAQRFLARLATSGATP